MRIDSTRNPLVRSLAKLRHGRDRRRQGRFLAEGRRLIDGLLAAGWTPEELLLRDGLAKPTGWPEATRISPEVAERLSTATTTSGYLAAFPLPSPREPDPATAALVLVAVGDPGNLGTLLRTAAARGLGQVLVVGGADPFGPKALQASAGAMAALALARLPAEVGPAELTPSVPLVATVPTGGEPPAALPAGPCWLCVGGEANGLPEPWIAAADHRLTLPMAPGVESLNAAIAGAIALYQLDLD